MPCPPQQPTESPLPTDSPPVTGLRLPRNLIPWHYNVDIQPDIYGSDPSRFSFLGRVDIYLACENQTNQITLQYRKMTIRNESVSVRDADGEQASIAHSDIAIDEAREFYHILLEDQLQIGDRIVVSVDFSGQLWEDFAGMFWNEYYVDGEPRWS